MLKGAIIIKSPIGADVVKEKIYHWCSCRKSKKQPSCDGSHKGSEFFLKAYKAEERIFFFVAANRPLINQFVWIT